MIQPNIFVVVKGHRSFCLVCSAAGHLAKFCPTKKSTLQTKPTSQPTPEQPRVEATKNVLSSEWTGVVRRGAKVTTPPLQQDVPDKSAAK